MSGAVGDASDRFDSDRGAVNAQVCRNIKGLVKSSLSLGRDLSR